MSGRKLSKIKPATYQGKRRTSSKKSSNFRSRSRSRPRSRSRSNSRGKYGIHGRPRRKKSYPKRRSSKPPKSVMNQFKKHQEKEKLNTVTQSKRVRELSPDSVERNFMGNHSSVLTYLSMMPSISATITQEKEDKIKELTQKEKEKKELLDKLRLANKLEKNLIEKEKALLRDIEQSYHEKREKIEMLKKEEEKLLEETIKRKKEIARLAKCNIFSTPENNIQENWDDDTSSKNTSTCKICFDGELEIAFNCGHICVCQQCAIIIQKGKKECPLCREKITSALRVYT